MQTGSPSVNMFISPDATVTVTSTHEQLFSAPYVFAGVCFPAQSVRVARAFVLPCVCGVRRGVCDCCVPYPVMYS